MADGFSDDEIGFSDDQIGGPPQQSAGRGFSDAEIGYSDDEISGSPHGRATPENPFVSGVREAAHSLIPGVVGAAVAPLGAAAGAPVGGPVGAFAGGAGAFIGGSLAAEYAQDKFLKNVVGYDDEEQRRANREANPKSSFGGGLVGAMATMSPFTGARTVGEQVLRRGTGAVAMGGFEAGGEALQGEDLNPTNIAMAGIAGAVAPGMNVVGKKVQAPAEKWLAGRPNKAPNPEAAPVKADVGAPDAGVPATGETLGNPQSAPTRSEKNYGKKKSTSYNEEDILTQGHMDPATMEALGQSTEKNALANDAVTHELPTEANKGEENVPIDAGFPTPAEAAAGPNIGQVGAKLRKPQRGPRPRADVAPEIDPGFPKAGEPVAEGEQVAAETPNLNKLKKPAKAETAIARSKAAAETPSDRIDTGFPKEGETLASSEEPASVQSLPSDASRVFQKLSKQGLSKAEIMSMTPEEQAAKALDNLRQPEKRGVTTPNDQVSDAQKRVGNYSKASVRDFGHDLKIETEKGDTRRSLDDSPVKWENVSPADYGYYKKTIGADKDHVDFYRARPDMPEFGDKHFIVDQRNAETGKFDEHKVMNYFKDLAAARDTYLKGFSDDKGPARLHDITEVSPKDLATWLRTKKKTKPYGEPMPQAAKKDSYWDGLVDRTHDRTGLSKNDRDVTATVKVKEPTGVPIAGAEGKPVTANSIADAQRKSKALADFQKVFDDHAPDPKRNAPETDKETIARARAAAEAASKLDNYPLKATSKSVAAEWVREAKKITKRPTKTMLENFRSSEVLLREGKKQNKPEAIQDVKDTNRASADKDLARGRGGDVAEAEAGKHEMPEGETEEPGVDLPPSLVKNSFDLSKLRAKDKQLDLTKPEDAIIVAGDTRKIITNLIKINDEPVEAAKPTNRASEALSLVEKGAVDKKPLKTKPGSAASEGRSITDPGEMKRIVDAANERMKSKKAAPSEEELDKYDFTKQEPVRPRDINGEERLWRRFLDDKSGAVNHQKIAADFRAKNIGLQQTLQKYFGIPYGETGKKAASVLARVVGTENSLTAEKAKQLTERWFAWVKGTTPAQQWTYLKAFEANKGKSRATLEQELRLAGIDKDMASWMADEGVIHKDIMDALWLEEKKHGSEAAYVEGYLAHIFDGDAKLAAEYLQKRGTTTLGPQWFQKNRTFDLLEQAEKAGFKLKYKNPIDIIQARWAASIKSNMTVQAARGLHDIGLAFPIKDVNSTHVKLLIAREGWQFKRNLPDHQEWIFAPGVEDLWMNSMEAKGLNEMQNPVGSLYRFWMGMKRVWAPIQLAFSAFHELHVAANINPAANLARAIKLSKNEFQSKDFLDAFKATVGHAYDATKWSLTDPILALPIDKIPLGVGKFVDRNGAFSKFAGRKAMNWWETPVDQLTPVQRIWKNTFREGGMSPYQSHEDVIGARRDFAQSLADLRNTPGAGPVARTMFNGIARGIEKMQEPMFKYQIPALKNVSYMRDVAAAFKMDPTLVTNSVKRGIVLRELAQNTDDRFGEMFYKGLFWNKTVKDAGIGSMLSMSWNLGQARQVFGAAKNIALTGARAMGHKQKPMADAIYNASDKATFVGTYVGLSMMSAGALSYALSGEAPKGLDYVFPRNGLNNPDGTPARLSTPFNTREPLMMMAHAQQHNSWLGGAMEFLWNKMVLGPVVEAFNNKDFFGNKLYDPNAPWIKRALQGLDSTAGRMLNPISLSGADRAKEQGGGKLQQGLAYAGFNPAPKYVGLDRIQNRINHAFGDEGTANSKPYQYGAKTGLGRGLVQGVVRAATGDKLESEARTEGRQMMNRGWATGDGDMVRQGRLETIKEGGLSINAARKMRPDNEFESKFARLPKETQIAIAREMDDDQFRKYVLLNRNAGLAIKTKADLIKEHSTNR